MMFGALTEAICFKREAYPVEDCRGIHGELAGFINLHSKLGTAKFGRADSTLPASDCRKPSHSTEESSCSGPKAMGSCFCNLLFQPEPTTFLGGRVTHIVRATLQLRV